MTVGQGHIDAVLTHAASLGLDDATGQNAVGPFADEDWEVIVTHAQLQRVPGFLATSAAAGRIVVTTDQLRHACDAHAGAIGVCLRLEAMLVSVLQDFGRSGLDHRVLKGPAFACLDYPDPALRTFGDIDLLVHPDQFDTCAELLRGLGYRRHFEELRPGFDRRFGKGASFTSPAGLQLDVHRTFVMGAFGLALTIDDLWRTSEAFDVAGVEARALDRTHRFMHACFHAALGRQRPELVPLRDVAGFLVDASVDWDAVGATSERWRCEPVVALALGEAAKRFDVVEQARATGLLAHRASRVERRALRTYQDPELGFAARQFAALPYVSGPEKLRYALALSVPARTYGTGRHASRIARWRSAAAQIIRLLWRARR